MVNFSKNTYILAECSIKHLQSKINDKKVYIKKLENARTTYQVRRRQHCHGLDQHIPNNWTRNIIKTEFELFYEGLLKSISHMTEEQVSAIKTKLCRTCVSYVELMYLTSVKKLLKGFQKTTILK